MGFQEGVGVIAADAGGGGAPTIASAWPEEPEPCDDERLAPWELLPGAWQLSSHPQSRAESECGDGFSGRLLRLERRSDLERKQLQRQLQRMERRMQDLLQSHMPSVGRWAELQGYVDGLAETVQGLLSRSNSVPSSSLLAGGGSEHIAAESSSRLLAARVDAIAEELTGHGSRLLKAEQSLSGLVEAELDGRLLDLETGAVAASCSDRSGNPSVRRNVFQETPPQSHSPPIAGQQLAQDLCDFGVELAHLREEVGNLQQRHSREDVSTGGQVEHLRITIEGQMASLKDEVARLDEWVQDADGKLCDQDTRLRAETAGRHALESEKAAVTATEMLKIRQDIHQLNTQAAALQTSIQNTDASVKDEVEALRKHMSSAEGDLAKRLSAAEEGFKCQQPQLQVLQEEVSVLRRERAHEPEQLQALQEALRTRLEEPVETSVSEAEFLRLRRHFDQAREDLDQVRSGRQKDFAKLRELEERLQLLREDYSQLLQGAQELRGSNSSLDASLSQHRQDAEGRLQQLEVQLAGLLAQEEEHPAPLGVPAEPIQRPRPSAQRFGAREMSELRGTLAELREQQAELAVGLGLRAQEEERSREALACYQDLRGQVERLGRQLPQAEQRSRDAKRGLDELSTEVKKLISSSSALSALEAQVGDIKQTFAEASEVASLAKSVLAFGGRLSKLEEGLSEAREVATAARLAVSSENKRAAELQSGPEQALALLQSSQLERRLQGLEDGMAEATRFTQQARSVPSIENKLQNMELKLAEALELSHKMRSLPALDVKLQRLDAEMREVMEHSQKVRALPTMEVNLQRLDSEMQEAQHQLSKTRTLPALEVKVVSLEREMAQAFAPLADFQERLRRLEEEDLQPMTEPVAVQQSGWQVQSATEEMGDRIRQLEENGRRLEELSKRHLDDILGAQEHGEACRSRLAALEGVVNPLSTTALELQRQLEDLQTQVQTLCHSHWKVEEELHQVSSGLEKTADLRSLPAQLDRLSSQHQDAEAALQEALRSVEQLAAKVHELSSSGQEALGDVSQVTEGHSSGKAACSPEELLELQQEIGALREELTKIQAEKAPEETAPVETQDRLRDLGEQVSQLRGEVLQLQEANQVQELRDAVERLQGEQDLLGAKQAACCREVEESAQELAAVRELRGQVQELTRASGQAHEQRQQHEELACDLSTRLRDAERQLGEELAEGLSRAEERSMRQAAVLEELAGQLTKEQEQMVLVQRRLQELSPALAASQLVTEVRSSLEEVRTAQAELDTRLAAAVGPEEVRGRLEELHRRQEELATWEAQRTSLGQRVEALERCLEGLAIPKPKQRWVRCSPPADAEAAGAQSSTCPSPSRAPTSSEADIEETPCRGGGCQHRSTSADSRSIYSLEQARMQARERLLSATLRLQPQSARLHYSSDAHQGASGDGSHSHSAGGTPDVEHISKELARHVRLEAHRAEAVSAVESRVGAMADRLTDICVRLDEAEGGLEAAGRGGVALRLRFEQLQSLLDARLHAISSELSDVASRQLTTERGLVDVASEGVRLRLEAQLRPLAQSPACSQELADRFGRN